MNGGGGFLANGLVSTDDDGEAPGLDHRLGRIGVALVADRQPLDLLAVELDQPRGEALPVGLEGRADLPIFLRLEDLDLALAVDDQAQRDRLHPARRLGARQLAPQDRRQREADQIIERAARPVGVDQILIEPARMLHRLGHRRIGDRVEGHALDVGRQRLLLPKHFLDVPADRLALAVGVGGEDQRVGVLRLVGDRLAAASTGRARPATASRTPGPDRPSRPWAAGRAHARTRRARGARGPDIFRWFSPWPAIRRRPASQDFLTHTRKGGVWRIPLVKRSCRLTLPPAWRSRRPARSSSSSAICTAPLDAPDRRMISSTGTGDGPSSSSTAPSTLSSPFSSAPDARMATAATRTRARSGRIASTTSARVLDQRRAVADQLVAALRARIERRAGHRHHLAPRLGGQPRGDQRAGPRRGLDHHRPALDPGDDPVAVREMARARLGPGRHFGEHQPALVQRRLPLLVFRRVEDVDAAGDDADRAAVQRAVVRRAVDPAGQARDDDQVLLPEIVRQAAREAARGRRGIARADDRDRRAGRAG